MENAHKLAQDLSPWGMFQNADVIVQGILIGLVMASVITWTIWLAKSIELFGAKRRVKQARDALLEARSLAEARHILSESSEKGIAEMLRLAQTELELSASISVPDGIRERVALGLRRIEAEHGRRMSFGTGVLATIGATSPFIGLFGTVWGIMNSFVGIAKAQTTNLAVVAPGIAEALLATAIGLAAAIPAVVIYNVFARSITGYKALLADASTQVLRLASRDLDLARHGSPGISLAARGVAAE